MAETFYAILDRIEAQSDNVAVPAGASPLDFLQSVYRDPAVPLPVRMRAAIEAAPYVHPKLAVTASLDVGDFARHMEEIARRTGRSNVIDAPPRPLPMPDGS